VLPLSEMRIVYVGIALNAIGLVSAGPRVQVALACVYPCVIIFAIVAVLAVADPFAPVPQERLP